MNKLLLFLISITVVSYGQSDYMIKLKSEDCNVLNDAHVVGDSVVCLLGNKKEQFAPVNNWVAFYNTYNQNLVQIKFKSVDTYLFYKIISLSTESISVLCYKEQRGQKRFAIAELNLSDKNYTVNELNFGEIDVIRVIDLVKKGNNVFLESEYRIGEKGDDDIVDFREKGSGVICFETVGNDLHGILINNSFISDKSIVKIRGDEGTRDSTFSSMVKAITGLEGRDVILCFSNTGGHLEREKMERKVKRIHLAKSTPKRKYHKIFFIENVVDVSGNTEFKVFGNSRRFRNRKIVNCKKLKSGVLIVTYQNNKYAYYLYDSIQKKNRLLRTSKAGGVVIENKQGIFVFKVG